MTHISVIFRFLAEAVGSSDITVEWKREVDTVSPFNSREVGSKIKKNTN